MRKCLYAGLVVQAVISLVVLVPTLYKSTREFFLNSSLTEEARKELIYGNFYRSMTEYLTPIPVDDNAAIIEPPGDYADLFWILNYYFLPRKIYTFPDSSFLNSETRRQYNIKYLIRKAENGFYFQRL